MCLPVASGQDAQVGKGRCHLGVQPHELQMSCLSTHLCGLSYIHHSDVLIYCTDRYNAIEDPCRVILGLTFDEILIESQVSQRFDWLESQYMIHNTQCTRHACETNTLVNVKLDSVNSRPRAAVLEIFPAHPKFHAKFGDILYMENAYPF